MTSPESSVITGENLSDMTLFQQARNIHFSPDKIARINPENFFLLLLGPSAVGKSSIIRALNENAPGNFLYISPYTTRSLRVGEIDKVSVSNEQFDGIKALGNFVCTNEMYDTRYGTPLLPILDALSDKQIPVLDFPLDRVAELIRPEYDILPIYVFPPSILEWVKRLQNEHRFTEGRAESGISELSSLLKVSEADPSIFYSVISDGSVSEIANEILSLISIIRGKK